MNIIRKVVIVSIVAFFMLFASSAIFSTNWGICDEPESFLSGTLEKDVRVVKVRAFRYGFDPDPIVVRLGEKVRVEVTSSDVTHGLAIKEFGINVVAPVGKTNSVEFTVDKAGDFRIRCSVYCGPKHGRMRGTLKVIE